MQELLTAYENPSWNTFCRVLNQLVHAWVFNLTAICPFEMEAFISWRQILSAVTENSNSNDIVINPYSGRQALVWVNPIFIRLVIKNAMKTLENRQTEKE